jgi:hypothetical protein
MSEIEVRDRRRRPFFMIDNHVLDKCMKLVGVTAWAVYCVLVRFAVGTTKPRVSVRTIADLLGVTTRTAMRGKKKLEKHFLIRSHKTQSISIIELLEVTQLEFTSELFSGSDTSVTTEKKPEVTTVSPPRGHKSHFRGDINVPTSYKTVSNKTFSNKTQGSSRGIEPRPGSSRSELEKLKTELAELREKGMQLMKVKGARHKDVYAIGDQADELVKKINLLRARAQ